MSQDEQLRAAERRAAVDPEALEALRALQFKLGRPPFPRELNTPEWKKVFEKETSPGVFMEPCRHGAVGTDATDEFWVAHRCGHEDPKHKGGIAWSLESVKRIEWRQETWSRGPSVEGERLVHGLKSLPSLRLSMVYEQHDGCSIHLAATFLDAGGERGYELCGGMSATHCPCPTWMINTETGRPFQGRDVTVGGSPYVINPLESFRVEVGSPGRTRTCACAHGEDVHTEHGCMGGGKFGDGRRPEIVPACACIGFRDEDMTPADGALRCTCGHSRANHGTHDTLDFGTGPCLPDCSCRAFASSLGPDVRNVYVRSFLDGVLTSPLCECGHPRRIHSMPRSASPGVCQGPCDCRAFVRVPVCRCGHVRACHMADKTCVLGGDGEGIADPQGVEVCDCTAWEPVEESVAEDPPAGPGLVTT